MGTPLRFFPGAQMEACSLSVLYVWEETSIELLTVELSKLRMQLLTHCLCKTTKFSQCKMDGLFVTTDRESMDALLSITILSSYVQVVLPPLTELKLALKYRKLKALTPYDLDAWQHCLFDASLINKYAHLPNGFY